MDKVTSNLITAWPFLEPYLLKHGGMDYIDSLRHDVYLNFGPPQTRAYNTLRSRLVDAWMIMGGEEPRYDWTLKYPMRHRGD